MSEMVERVAWAIDSGAFSFGGENVRTREARRLAILAIAAMRVPTEAMTVAGLRGESESGESVDIWQAMIDAALKAP